jgi:hypothetical protein
MISGATASMERRHEVLALARKYKFLILEGIPRFPCLMAHRELTTASKTILITSFTTAMKRALTPTSPLKGRTMTEPG